MNTKYPSKWKTFQVPPLTNDALAIIDWHTLLESTVLNYINNRTSEDNSISIYLSVAVLY